jgi:hypothetical protein
VQWQLTGRSRTALSRLQTLRATVDWSHDLLSTPEWVLLRRPAAFADGRTLAAAVCSGGPVATEAVLDLPDGLEHKSVVLMEAPTGVHAGTGSATGSWDRLRPREVPDTPMRPPDRAAPRPGRGCLDDCVGCGPCHLAGGGRAA